MDERADAHIHLFENGYQGESFTKRPGVVIDEVSCYASFVKDHNVSAALVVGYAGEAWALQNNEFLARMAGTHKWTRPVAYVEPADPPNTNILQRWNAQGFVGISFYVFNQIAVDALHRIPDECWSYVVDHHWLVSVNSRGQFWSAWQAILKRHEDLRLVISHLGLPARVSAPPEVTAAGTSLADVLDLAGFPGPRVKLSGFYALTDPGHDYPHTAVWPYVELLLDRFGAGRLLWGSDFSPCLDWLSFPQTFSLLAKMPFLGDIDRQKIEGANLLALLDECG